MRNYLNDFMTKWQYTDEDKAFLLEAYDKICANSEAKAEFDRKHSEAMESFNSWFGRLW